MKPTDSFVSLDDWLPWLESLSPREIVLGLERVHEVLGRLDLPRPGMVISVAGTNGKGSCVAMLEAILRSQGIRTGSYTSPHLRAYNERTRIDGRPADDEAILAALQAVEGARGETPLTFFEFGTLATLVAFAAAEVDAWVLEVGMGGRLDAVNAIEPDGCLITNIALDHCAWLGDDVEAIAAEKAGIMRCGKPVVFGSLVVPDAIGQVAGDVGAELVLAGRDFSFEVSADRSWSYRGQRLQVDDMAPLFMAGDVQIGNAASVLALFEALGRDDWIDATVTGNALANIRLEGRFQRIGDRWILDVAHNPAAAEVLANQIAGLGCQGHVTAIIGMLADKDVAGYAAPLAGVIDRFLAVPVDATRGATAQFVAQEIANATNQSCQVYGDLAAALGEGLAAAGDNDLLLVTGSFFIVGPALQWIKQNDGAPAAVDQGR